MKNFRPNSALRGLSETPSLMSAMAIDSIDWVGRKRPRSYTPEGEEVLDEARPPWSSVARAALQASTSDSLEPPRPFLRLDKKDDEGRKDEEARSEANERKRRNESIARMFEKIFAAKSELEVILDTLGELQRGTMLTIGGVEKPRTKLADQAPILAAERKRKQLASISSSFRDAHAALSAKVRASETFYADLRRLQRKWKVRQSARNPQTGFCFDLSFNQLDLEHNPIEILKEDAGDLYIVVDSLGGENEARNGEIKAVGAAQVDRVLTAVQNNHLRSNFRQALCRKMHYAAARDVLHAKEVGLSALLTLTKGAAHLAAATPMAEAALRLWTHKAFLKMFEGNKNEFAWVIDRFCSILQHEDHKARVLEILSSKVPSRGFALHYEDRGDPLSCAYLVKRRGEAQPQGALCVRLAEAKVRVKTTGGLVSNLGDGPEFPSSMSSLRELLIHCD